MEIFCFFFIFVFISGIYNHIHMQKLLRKLVQTQSTAEKGELPMARILSDEFQSLGIEAFVDSWDKKRANLIARVKSEGTKGGLLFACHLDIVPAGETHWSHPPFSAAKLHGRIYGRGSADMKGGITAVIFAIRKIIDSGVRLKGDLIFLGAAGEETDSCGAKRFLNKQGSTLPELAGVVVPEPTNFEVVTAHRGMLWLNISTQGKCAHGSTPKLGINAISSMKRVLAQLDTLKFNIRPHELLGQPSLSINTIEGGKAINVVPDNCRIGVDIRTVPGQNHQEIVLDIQRMLSRLEDADSNFSAEVSISRVVPALETDKQSSFVKEFCSAVGVSQTRAVSFTTDGPHFGPLGLPVVVFGPGSPELCHKPNEYIELSDIEKGGEYYKKLILKFLS